MPFPRALAPVLLIASQLVPLAPAFAEPPTRETSVIVYGEDPCPQADGDEVVVCARRPEEERYRIPRSIRERQQTEVSWASRVEGLDEESRFSRPNSCSVVGSLGQTGCMATMIQQWYAERRARRAEEERVP